MVRPAYYERIVAPLFAIGNSFRGPGRARQEGRPQLVIGDELTIPYQGTHTIINGDDFVDATLH